jgi:antirestriction protein ArdC
MNRQQFIDPYQLVTDTIIRQLEKGVVPWHCPWQRNVGRPRNFHTGREYQGINILLLGWQRLASPYWMTWKQLKEHGGLVKKGEHGSLVVKFGSFKKRVKGTDGTEEEKETFFLKGYKVFNSVQIEGVEFPDVTPAPSVERIFQADEIVQAMPQRPTVIEGRHAHAFYQRNADTVEVPSRESFPHLEDFYLTLYHELVHSTGHESRLNRKSLVENDGFGGKVYSEEELVAEMGAAFLGAEADIVRDDHEQSAAYLCGWLDVLKDKDHKRWIVHAANQAAKAADFVMNRAQAVKEVPDMEPTGA